MDKSADVNNDERTETKSDQENRIHVENAIAKQDKHTPDNEDPKPSTSHSNEEESPDPGKRYKKSLQLLQYEWCQKQPEFLARKAELLDTHR